jgi:uncharacterized hydrophobic protein (TIGR00271 family)
MSSLTTAWRSLTGKYGAVIEKPLSAAELGEAMQQVSIPNFGFYFMLGLATVIATLGLLSNSAPTIIGAMIIAPLMAPIISLSYGMTTTDWPLMGRSVVMVVTGVLMVVVLAYVATLTLGLRVAGSEILSRSFPSLLDLGVAMASGAAAAFAYTRRSIMSTIAGVAIAVALVPPLAVTGIGLAQGAAASADVGKSLAQLGLEEGGKEYAAGSFLLFLTNLTGIVVLAGAVFMVHGYGSWHKAALALFAVAAITLTLVHPLGVSLQRMYVRGQMLSVFVALTEKYPNLFTSSGRLDKILVDFRGEVVHVTVRGTASRVVMGDMQKRFDLIREYLQRSLRRPVVLDANVVAVDVFDYRSVPKTTGAAN